MYAPICVISGAPPARIDPVDSESVLEPRTVPTSESGDENRLIVIQNDVQFVDSLIDADEVSLQSNFNMDFDYSGDVNDAPDVEGNELS